MGRGGDGQSSTDAARRLSEAVAATERGSVFLLGARSKKPRDCGYNCRDTGCADAAHVHATRDPREIARRCARDPEANYGILPAPGLLVLDVDGGEVPFDLPATVTALTGGGGRHLWFALPAHDMHVVGKVRPDPDVAVDVIGSGGSPCYVVGTGSIHPNGQPYQWAPGLSPADLPIAVAPPALVEWLDRHGRLVTPTGQAYAAEAASSTERPGIRPSAPGIKQSKTSDRLPEFIPQGERRATVQSILGKVWNRPRTTPADLAQLAADLHGRCQVTPGTPYTIEEALESARYIASRPKKDTATRGWIERTAALAESQRWPGVGGTVRRRILLTVLAKAHRLNRTTFRMSQRELAELAGVSRSSLWRHLRKLTADGWFSRHNSGRETEASTFKLLRPEMVQSETSQKEKNGRRLVSVCTTPSRPPTPPRGPKLARNCEPPDPRWDAWRLRDGLGESCRRALQVLATGECFTSAAAVAEAMQASRHTANRALLRLKAHGLARHEEGIWFMGDADLEVVTAHLDSDGAGERQRQRHQRERENHAAFLVVRRLNRTPCKALPMAEMVKQTGLSAAAVIRAARRERRRIAVADGWLRLKVGRRARTSTPTRQAKPRPDGRLRAVTG